MNSKWRLETCLVGVRLIAGMLRHIVLLWNRPHQDARVILEQQGELKYFTVPARLQKYLVRGSIACGTCMFALFAGLLAWTALLQTGKNQLERSHLEIYAALVGSDPDAEQPQQTRLDQESMLLLAQAIRDRDLEIRRYVDSATLSLNSENGNLSSRLEATGLSERAVKAIQASQPAGGFRSDEQDISDPLLNGKFAAESARNQSLKEVLQALPARMPVSDYSISSRFGIRTHPITQRPGFHAGLDLVTRSDDAVFPAKEGKVILARNYNNYGNTVIVRHERGIETLYAHLASIAVREGQEVDTETRLGEVGNTGASTGKHLHFEVSVGGYPVDPLKVMQTAEYVQQAQK